MSMKRIVPNCILSQAMYALTRSTNPGGRPNRFEIIPAAMSVEPCAIEYPLLWRVILPLLAALPLNIPRANINCFGIGLNCQDSPSGHEGILIPIIREIPRGLADVAIIFHWLLRPDTKRAGA